MCGPSAGWKCSPRSSATCGPSHRTGNRARLRRTALPVAVADGHGLHQAQVIVGDAGDALVFVTDQAARRIVSVIVVDIETVSFVNHKVASLQKIGSFYRNQIICNTAGKRSFTRLHSLEAQIINQFHLLLNIRISGEQFVFTNEIV